jgi:hypothetical protein
VGNQRDFLVRPHGNFLLVHGRHGCLIKLIWRQFSRGAKSLSDDGFTDLLFGSSKTAAE